MNSLTYTESDYEGSFYGDDSRWVKRAYQVLKLYTSACPKKVFTSSEFYRWAEYFHNVPPPNSQSSYGLVFRRANSTQLIAYAGRNKRRLLWISTNG